MDTFSTANFLRFKCQNHGACCQNWDILFSKEMIQKLKKAPVILPEIENHPDFYEEVNPDNEIFNSHAKTDQGKCIFLRPGNICAIFKEYGKNQGNPLCLTFPFIKLKLPDRYTITTSMSCLSEIDEIFSDTSLSEVQLKQQNLENFNFSLPFNHLQKIKFNKTISISWDNYFRLEKTFIKRAESPSISFPDLENILLSVYRQLTNISADEFNDLILEKIIDNISVTETSYSKNTDYKDIFFFIERKKKLYNHQPFINGLGQILDLNEEKIAENTDIISFNKSYKIYNNPLKRLFILKFYSAQSNFLYSIEFFWHVLFFYFKFLKLFVFSRWREESNISNKTLKEAVFFTERYFMHDPQVFKFWGQGRRGEKDFHSHSLRNLLC